MAETRLPPTPTVVVLLHPLTSTAYERFLAAFDTLGVISVLCAVDGGLAQTYGPQFNHVIPLASLAVGAEQLCAEIAGAGLQPAAILAGCEYTVTLADDLARRFGCVYHDNPTPLTVRDKRQMRAAFARAGVPQPRVLATLSRPEELDALDLEALRYPVIIKPADLAGSNFVRLCHDAAEVRAYLPPILACHASPSSGVPWAGSALIEAVAYGDEYSIEVVVQGGALLAAWPTRKWLSPWPHCDETGHLHGVALSEPQQRAVDDAMRRVIEAWSLDAGVLHAELKLDGTDVQVIEVANRIAGEKISELVEHTRGVSLELVYTRLRLGLDVTGQLRQRPGNALHGVKFFFFPETPVTRPVPVGVTPLAWGGPTEFPPLAGSHPGPQHACHRSGSLIFATTDPQAAAAFLDA